MYIFEGLISREGEISDGWALIYHVMFDLSFSPARAFVIISDMVMRRTWVLGDFVCDLRTAHGPRNI